jgi:5-keto 4-deoxyuronate isomerase
MDILNSNSLYNLKQRNGLYISTGNSVSLYTSQNKLKKFLMIQLEPHFQYKNDMEVLVDKIVDRCSDMETLEIVRDFYNSITPQEFISLANSKIRTFFRAARQLVD